MSSYRIFEYLKKKRVIDYYLLVSAESELSVNGKPNNLLEWDSSPIYHSKNKINQYVRFDFPISMVYIENFSIKTARNRDPYNWVFEGSKDSTNFETLYENTAKKLCEWIEFDNIGTRGCTQIITHSFSVNNSDYYKSFRLRQTGSDSNNENFLVLSALEIIGSINLIQNTCITKRNHHYNIFIIIMIISKTN